LPTLYWPQLGVLAAKEIGKLVSLYPEQPQAQVNPNTAEKRENRYWGTTREPLPSRVHTSMTTTLF